MNQQTSELIGRIKQLGPTGLARLDPEILDEVQAVLETAAHDDIEAKLRREEASFDCGPLLWLTRYTKTENPQYEAQGLPFLAPFPAKEYFVELFRAFLKRDH